MLAVKKLMLESLLSYRFGGTTMSYSELLIALENIVIKVSTVPTAETGRLTQVPRWKSEWRQQMMAKVRVEREIKGL